MSLDPPHARIAPPVLLAEPAPAAVLRALPGARAVGGCVRDLLVGRPVADVDVAAPLPPDAIAARLREAGLKVVETGIAHGTVTAILAGEPVEVTALRRDVRTDGRHAEVEWTEDWREDAARRDFTINAMSLSAAGELWDYFGGRDDLAAGRVRFVGVAATRLAEDYLRALRFFRFQARYGKGATDAEAVAAIRDAVPRLGRLSAERVWSELKRLLSAPDPLGALRLMEATGVLGAVLPEAAPPGFAAPRFAALGRLLAAGAPLDPLLRLLALLPPEARDGQALAERLRLSNEEREVIVALQDRAGEPVPSGDAGDGTLLAWMSMRPPGELQRALWLAEARDGVDRAALRRRVAALPYPVFPLLGRDALAMGVPPGPEVGQLLAQLRDWWRAGGCAADSESCRAELARHLRARTKEAP